jgi:hypothetical protein
MKTITFGGKEFQLDDIPFRGVKKVIPLVNKLVPMAAKQDFTEEFFDNFVELFYNAAIFTNPDLTREEILDLKPKIVEMGPVLDAIISCAGLEFTGSTAPGNVQAASL